MSAIPEKYIAFCEAVAKLAVAAELRSMSVTLQPGFGQNEWRDSIQMVWRDGRHGEEAHGCVVTSTVTVQHKFQRPTP